jgi:hypothetical protein
MTVLKNKTPLLDPDSKKSSVSLVHALQGLNTYFEEESAKPKTVPYAAVAIDELQEEYLRQLELVGGYDLLKDVLQVMKEKNQIIYGERRVYD